VQVGRVPGEAGKRHLWQWQAVSRRQAVGAGAESSSAGAGILWQAERGVTHLAQVNLRPIRQRRQACRLRQAGVICILSAAGRQTRRRKGGAGGGRQKSQSAGGSRHLSRQETAGGAAGRVAAHRSRQAVRGGMAR